MIKKNKIYYCNECKKITANINEIFFVEQSRFRGFCCEECITKFYSPMISYLKKEEESIRKELSVNESFNFDQKTYEKIIEKGIRNPQEVWIDGEDLSEEFFCLISQDDKHNIFVIILTLFFENTPSLVLFETITNDQKIVEHYRQGKKIDITNEKNISTSNLIDVDIDEKWNESSQDNQKNSQKENNFNIPPEVVRILESKKSQLLSNLLKDRSATDISIDQFPHYDYCLHETIENPDEVYRLLDSGKDILLTYIKVFSKENISFYYLVICLQHSNDSNSNEENYLIPIISFPTVDGELYRKYKKGEKIEGTPIS
ncbi:MAG: hypothetical protein HQK51_08965 [Oligoflexia bacterium]|nr:hypothetical protein [Oligoflexia bacterium]